VQSSTAFIAREVRQLTSDWPLMTTERISPEIPA
jgi:hypothetical protein